ncbi:MAG: hypothetical protein FWF34_01090 [Alphaproteobacteria bacterium]|nr:hypothetical protein [Alphaproteobacteria bacterium]MCL2889838.1 hypothetical protein [Alphaproteobacteria bacterium]
MSKINKFKTLALTALVAAVPFKAKSQDKQDTNNRPLIESVDLNMGVGTSANGGFVQRCPTIMMFDVKGRLKNDNSRFSTSLGLSAGYSEVSKNTFHPNTGFLSSMNEHRYATESMFTFGINAAQEYQTKLANISVEAIARAGMSFSRRGEEINGEAVSGGAWTYRVDVDKKESFYYSVGLGANIPVYQNKFGGICVRVEGGLSDGMSARKPVPYGLVGLGFRINNKAR